MYSPVYLECHTCKTAVLSLESVPDLLGADMDRYIAFRAQSALFLALQMEARERRVSVSRVIRDLLARGVACDRAGTADRARPGRSIRGPDNGAL